MTVKFDVNRLFAAAFAVALSAVAMATAIVPGSPVLVA
ncbi:enoyl-CoA hydratase [Parerythrobacter jejuensis]|nr:enoyl-CoA hydratase [Parerythrobacter jejuensis]